jgi:hypothetical protein
MAAGINQAHRLVGQLGDGGMGPQLTGGAHDLLVALPTGPGSQHVSNGTADDHSSSKTHVAMIADREPLRHTTAIAWLVVVRRCPPLGAITTGSETK